MAQGNLDPFWCAKLSSVFPTDNPPPLTPAALLKAK